MIILHKKALQGNLHIKCSLMQCSKIHLAFIIFFVLCRDACPESIGQIYGAAVLVSVTNAWFNCFILCSPLILYHIPLGWSTASYSDSVLKWAYSPCRFSFHHTSDLFLCQLAFNGSKHDKDWLFFPRLILHYSTLHGIYPGQIHSIIKVLLNLMVLFLFFFLITLV